MNNKVIRFPGTAVRSMKLLTLRVRPRFVIHLPIEVGHDLERVREAARRRGLSFPLNDQLVECVREIARIAQSQVDAFDARAQKEKP